MTGSRVCELIFEAMGEHLGSVFAHAPSKTRRRCYGRRPVDADTQGTGYHQLLIPRPARPDSRGFPDAVMI